MRTNHANDVMNELTCEDDAQTPSNDDHKRCDERPNEQQLQLRQQRMMMKMRRHQDCPGSHCACNNVKWRIKEGNYNVDAILYLIYMMALFIIE